jgi:Lon protease-like protein
MTKKGKKKVDEGNSDFQEPDKTVNVLFGRLPTRQSQKATRREVLNIEPAAPTHLRWSEVLKDRLGDQRGGVNGSQ